MAETADGHNFVTEVLHFSSQYGSDNGVSYTITNIIGYPNSYPSYGDFSRSAVFRTYGPWWKTCPSRVSRIGRPPPSFISDDFIDVSFEQAVVPGRVDIYETYTPGSVVKICAFTHEADDDLLGEWVTLWEGGPTQELPQSRIFSPPLKRVNFNTRILHVEFCHDLCDYYSEFDAINLIGQQRSNRETAYTPLLSYICCDKSIFTSNCDDTSNRDNANNRDNTSAHINNADGHQRALWDTSTVMLDNSVEQQTHENETDEEDDHEPHLFYYSGQKDVLNNGICLVQRMSAPHVHQGSGDGIMLGLHRSMRTLCRMTSHTNCLSELPEEVIQLILCYLDRISLCRLSHTCRLLHKHCYDSLQFTQLCLKPHWARVTAVTLHQLIERCTRLKLLDLSWCGDRSYHGDEAGASPMSCALIELLTQCGSELICLRLASSLWLVSDAVIETLPAACPLLQELNLDACGSFKKISWMAVSRLKHLTHAKLSRTNLSTSLLYYILVGCHELSHLDVSACLELSHNTAVDPLSMITAAQIRTSKLKSVIISRCMSVTDEGVAVLAKCCPLLEEVDVGWCPKLTAATPRYLTNSCHKLKKLFLTANRMVTDQELYAIADHCPLMEQLDILGTRGVSIVAVKMVLERCRHLKFFDLSFCFGITFPMIGELRDKHPAVSIKYSYQC